MTLLIKNGTVHDAVTREPYPADILCENGRIVRIEAGIATPADAEIFDATGLDVYPGFIDAHTHIGMFGVSGVLSKDDVEKSALIAPEQRALDATNPLEPSFRSAYEAGVTTVCVCPGSVSAIAGSAVALKTYGYLLSDMVVRDPVAMKAAIGENPKSHQASVTTRMTLFAAIRDALYRAKEYEKKKTAAKENGATAPAFDAKCEALLPVIRKEIPLKVHGYRVDDLQSIIRLAKELDVRLTLEHATDAFMLADMLRENDIPVAMGPYFTQNRRSESTNKSPVHAAELIRAGVQVSLMTDAPAVSIEHLALTAGLVMREGVDEFEALKTITANPARHLGIADRVGSIAVGLDADFVISHGSPLSLTRPDAVFIDGKCVFRR